MESRDARLSLSRGTFHKENIDEGSRFRSRSPSIVLGVPSDWRDTRGNLRSIGCVKPDVPRDSDLRVAPKRDFRYAGPSAM